MTETRGGTAQRLLRRADEAQRNRPVLAFPFAVLKKFGDDRAGQMAALIAYYGFFSLFPLLLVFVTVVAFVIQNDAALQERLLDLGPHEVPHGRTRDRGEHRRDRELVDPDRRDRPRPVVGHRGRHVHPVGDGRRLGRATGQNDRPCRGASAGGAAPVRARRVDDRLGVPEARSTAAPVPAWRSRSCRCSARCWCRRRCSPSRTRC